MATDIIPAATALLKARSRDYRSVELHHVQGRHQEFCFAKEEILFVSSNAWDALAAKWYGFDVFWINRYGHPFEEIGERPNYEGKQLGDILPVVLGNR